MTGYVRVDTSNNIADGNVISAADLDNEFDGVQAGFNASTGHTHGGAAGEGAPITKIGPTQDVTASASLLAPKTTNTVDVGSSLLKFKDLWLSGNASVAGTLGVTGVATLTAQPILSSLTASRAVFTDASKGLVSNAITGTGNVVMSASPTLTGTINAEALTLSGTVTATGGTANGVPYLNGSKVLTSGSALTFDGTNLFSTGGATFQGGPIGYGGGEVNLGTTAAGQTSGIATLASGSPILFFDHRGTSNTGVFAWRNGAGASNELARLTNTGLGLGTNSPGAKLELSQFSTTTPSLRLRYSSTSYYADHLMDGNGNYVIKSPTANGVTSGNVLLQAAGTLYLYTNNAEAARFDSSGNLGLGVTPPAIGSNRRALVIGGQAVASVYHYAGVGESAYNWYLDAAFAVKYATTNYAGTFEFNNSATGGFAWKLAPSGTAGAAISFTQALTLDASGNLGLGVTPSAWGSGWTALQVKQGGASIWTDGAQRFFLNSNTYYNGTNRIYQNTGAATEYSQSGGVHAWSTAPSGTAGAAITFTQAMTLDASGYLLVGATSTSGAGTGRFQVGDTNTASQMLVKSNTAHASLYASTAADTYFSWNTSGFLAFGQGPTNGSTFTERARIDSSGNLLVGTTSAGINRVVSDGGFQSQGASQFNIYSTNSSTQFEWVMRAGTEMQFYVSNASVLAKLTASGVWTNASDARYKENIRPVTYGLAEVMQLKPRAYNIIGSDKQEIGFVAQEVEPLIPELVDSSRNSVTEEDRLTLSYGQMSAVLVAAIQEQQALILTLQADVAALKAAA